MEVGGKGDIAGRDVGTIGVVYGKSVLSLSY